MAEFNAWIFQGNPYLYDMEGYLQSSKQIYWNTPKDKKAESIAIGDPVIIWRSKKHQGAIAIGRVNELPTEASEVLHPEALGRKFWKGAVEAKESEWKTGIQLADDIRVGSAQGMVAREQFMQHPLLQELEIIKRPWSGTLFQLSKKEFQAFEELLGGVSSVCDTRSFWWVSHGSSFHKELDGGYIWCPVVRDEDIQKPHWINVSKVRKGDLIVSFAKGLIRAIGVAVQDCVEAAVPEGYTSWHGLGWRVEVDWVLLENEVRPKDHISQLINLLPAHNSPLRSSGDANQFYLCEISKRFFDKLSVLISDKNVMFDEKLDDAEIDATSNSKTEATYLRKARIGQGKFRAGVNNVCAVCCVTGTADQRVLIASHIKPWRESTNEERLDPYNGLMLAPHIDRLFDQGLISFSDEGRILVSDLSIRGILESWGVDATRVFSPFQQKHLPYLAYHRVLFGFIK